MMDFGAARLTMVDSQLRPNKVTDPAVLDAFLAVPRERFVPPALRAAAYVDDDIPIGDVRVLMQPMVLARLIRRAAIGAGDVAEHGRVVAVFGDGIGMSRAALMTHSNSVLSSRHVCDAAVEDLPGFE